MVFTQEESFDGVADKPMIAEVTTRDLVNVDFGGFNGSGTTEPAGIAVFDAVQPFTLTREGDEGFVVYLKIEVSGWPPTAPDWGPVFTRNVEEDVRIRQGNGTI